MKKSILIISVLFLLCGTSCNNILNVEPEIYVSDNTAFTDDKSAYAALIGVYDATQNYYGPNLNSHNVISDNVVNNTSPGNIIPTLTAAGSSGADPTGGGAYGSMYEAINRANSVIVKTAALSETVISIASKNQYMGEAYFLRALAYATLVKTYGGVPIILEPTSSPTQDNGIKRSTVAENYAQILTDLDKAESLLSTTIVRNRANKWSVYALKARIFLYTEKWELSEEQANKLISNTTFKLVKPYSTFYTTAKSDESIFELTFSAADKNPVYTNYLAALDGGRLDYIPEGNFVAQLLDPNLGGARKSLVKLQPDGKYTLAQYGKQDGSSSFFVLRIAEQYLIRAEARANKTAADLVGAVADINLIKIRSDVPTFVSTSSTTKQDILLAIEKERRYELGFEGHRFIDIVRTNRAAKVFGDLNPLFTNPQRWVFPIPYGQLLADPDLVQNPGY